MHWLNLRVCVQIPRFAFEKFPGAKAELTTQMKSVGEAMAMGRTFQESFQKVSLMPLIHCFPCAFGECRTMQIPKAMYESGGCVMGQALRSLETGLEGWSLPKNWKRMTKQQLEYGLRVPNPDRMMIIKQVTYLHPFANRE